MDVDFPNDKINKFSVIIEICSTFTIDSWFIRNRKFFNRLYNPGNIGFRTVM